MTNRLRGGHLAHHEQTLAHDARAELYARLGDIIDLLDATTPQLIFDVGDNDVTVAVSSSRNGFVRARKRIEYLQHRAPGDDW